MCSCAFDKHSYRPITGKNIVGTIWMKCLECREYSVWQSVANVHRSNLLRSCAEMVRHGAIGATCKGHECGARGVLSIPETFQKGVHVNTEVW